MELAAMAGSLAHRMNSVRLQVARMAISSTPSARTSSSTAEQRLVSLM